MFIVRISKKPQKTTADYYLIAVNLLVGLFILADVWVNWQLHSFSVILQNGTPLFLFPVYVFYVFQFTHANRQLSPWWYLLYVPGGVFLLLSSVDHFILNSYPDLKAIEQHFEAPILAYHLIFKGAQLLFIGVLIYVLRLLRNFEWRIKAGFSTIDTIELNWLVHFTWIYLSSLMITFVLFLSHNLGLLPFDIKGVFGIVYGFLVVAVFYLNYEGIQHYTLSQVRNADSTLQSSAIPMEKPPVSGDLSEEEQELERRMLALLQQDRLYLEPRFSLDDLASRLDESKHRVSKVINAKPERSFYELVNRFRVDHLKNLLDDPAKSNFTILALGLESGFNSKASLNRIFKTTTGLTPRQYLVTKSQTIH